MSIFVIALITFVITFVIASIGFLVMFCIHEEQTYGGDISGALLAVFILISLILWVIFTVIGVGINTECHRVWIAEFEAQKYTIEASIDSETLSGLERIQLVTKAAELNGELARRKTEFNLWHHVVFDKTLYDGVELIQIK